MLFQLLDANTALSGTQSQKLRDLQQWKERSDQMINVEDFTRLQVNLVDQQRQIRELQNTILEKENRSNILFKGKVILNKYNMMYTLIDRSILIAVSGSTKCLFLAQKSKHFIKYYFDMK
jgi:hypothetical protein